jgi:transposase-like protein
MGEKKDSVARKQRSYEVEFKEAAVGRMLRGENVVRLSAELGVRRSVLYRWRDTYRAEGRAGLERRQGRPRPGQEIVKLDRDPSADRIAELERLVGKQAAELDFFGRAFNALKPAIPNSDARNASGSTVSSTKSALKADSVSSEPANSPRSAGPDITVN